MMTIIEKIKELPKVYHTQKSSKEQIQEVEKRLSLKFPAEYKIVLEEYDSISFYSTEWYGINVKNYANVEYATQFERENNDKFPRDCFVLENLGVDGWLTICDQEGKVYSYNRHGKRELWANSLSEYLDICIARKNQR